MLEFGSRSRVYGCMSHSLIPRRIHKFFIADTHVFDRQVAMGALYVLPSFEFLGLIKSPTE
jgi:hypothetical protein